MHRYVQKDIQGTTEPQFRNSHSRTSGTVTLYLPVSTFVGTAYFHERRSLNNFHRDRVITFEQIAE